MTSILLKTVGIHFITMFGYIVVVGLIDTDILLGTMFFLPIHVLLLLTLSISSYVEYSRDKINKKDRLTQSKVYLLTTLIIGIVGFSSCSHMFINKI